VAALAVALAGCSSIGLDNDQPLFRKHFDFTGQAGGYTFSDTQQAKREQPITPADLIAANGSCPPPPVAPVAPAPAATAGPAAEPVVAPDTPSLLGEGVALGMSECEVVWRAGAPNNVERRTARRHLPLRGRAPDGNGWRRATAGSASSREEKAGKTKKAGEE
jgi:hypothetical protein